MIVTYWSLNKITKYEMHNKAIWQYGRYLDNVKIIINEKDKIQLLRNNNVVAEDLIVYKYKTHGLNNQAN